MACFSLSFASGFLTFLFTSQLFRVYEAEPIGGPSLTRLKWRSLSKAEVDFVSPSALKYFRCGTLPSYFRLDFFPSGWEICNRRVGSKTPLETVPPSGGIAEPEGHKAIDVAKYDLP